MATECRTIETRDEIRQARRTTRSHWRAIGDGTCRQRIQRDVGVGGADSIGQKSQRRQAGYTYNNEHLTGGICRREYSTILVSAAQTI